MLTTLDASDLIFNVTNSTVFPTKIPIKLGHSF